MGNTRRFDGQRSLLLLKSWQGAGSSDAGGASPPYTTSGPLHMQRSLCLQIIQLVDSTLSKYEVSILFIVISLY